MISLLPIIFNFLSYATDQQFKIIAYSNPQVPLFLQKILIYLNKELLSITIKCNIAMSAVISDIYS